MEVTVEVADASRWEDLAAVFGTRGAAATCWCQRYKLRPKEAFRRFPAEERAARLREQTADGAGLIAYADGEPAGWCSVEPRCAYAGLLRHARVPWEGREEDKDDATVWALTCLLTRVGYRRRGVSRALAQAAVTHARDRGARALEAYPILTTDVISEELHVGTQDVFHTAGMTVVSRPTPRRAVMRIDFV